MACARVLTGSGPGPVFTDVTTRPSYFADDLGARHTSNKLHILVPADQPAPVDILPALS